ncbi:MAG: hypothetical protein J6J42_08705 [Lachnospiraceae bacterium]|nr:hypothetical protein [Lachnospiraceae bacterium]
MKNFTKKLYNLFLLALCVCALSGITATATEEEQDEPYAIEIIDDSPEKEQSDY